MATTLEEDNELQNTSYLNARVQSILAQNFPHNNLDEIPENEDSTAAKTDDNLQIYLRVKKSSSFETLYDIKNNNTLLCKVPKPSQNNRHNHADSVVTKIFKFSRVFGPETSQSEIFNGVVQNKVVNFINGINCTLLTYGASGSGKTFTIVGNSNQPGIIPRSLECLFCTLPELSLHPTFKPTHSGGIYKLSESESSNEKSIKTNLISDLQDVNHHRQVYSAMQQELRNELIPIIDEDISDVHLSVWISFAEIYNEYVYDLLAPPLKNGVARNKLRLVYYKNNAYAKDLKYINVSSASDAYCVLQYGLQNLKFASTSINDHSSRSHSIFTIRLAQVSDSKEGISVSAFNFCDLAGSERTKKTNNVGDRLKESNNINTSLMVLGRCISAIKEAQKCNGGRIVPFRDSKFTQLLQNALSGNEAIFMIVNINPIAQMFDESQHVLNFSAIAKNISIEKQQFIERPKNKLTNKALVDQNDAEVEELQIQLAIMYDTIEQERLTYEEEKDYIIQKYKEMIANTNEMWKGTCQTLQIHIAENTRSCLDAADTSINLIENDTNRKRKKISVITIDSSSDEEVDKDEALNKKSKTKCSKLIELQDELRLLQNEFETNEVVLQNLLTKNKSINNHIEDGKAIHDEMECQYKEEIEKLNAEILKQDDKISELNKYYESCTTKKGECL